MLHFLTRVIMTIFVVTTTRSVLLICSPITLTRFVLSPSPLRSPDCQFFLESPPFFPIYLFPSQFNLLPQIFLFLSSQFHHFSFSTSVLTVSRWRIDTLNLSSYFFFNRNTNTIEFSNVLSHKSSVILLYFP